MSENSDNSEMGNDTEEGGNGLSTSARVLGVIDLFTVDRPQWTIDEIAARLALARTTAYRYTRTLVDAGFLASLNAGSYVLGPRLIALDRQIRLSDPMLRAAVPIMASIRREADGLQQLCSYYGDQVMCIHHETSQEGLDTTVERGRPYPLFMGASRVILANLPARQLQRFMLDHAAEIARAGLGENWQQFNKTMRGIRQQGYYAAVGEIDPENYGVAAPILHSKGIAGCLRIARPVSRLKDRDVPALIELAVETADRISAAIQQP